MEEIQIAEYVDLIMVSYNSQRFLRPFLGSLKNHTMIPYRLIIIDNHSTDNSRSFLTHFKRSDPLGSELKLVFNTKNIGVAKAWNHGLDLSNGKYIGFLNPDILFSENWLPKMVDCAKRHPNAGVIGAKILDYNGRHICHAGFVNNQLRGYGEPNIPGGYEQETEVDSIHGCCFLVNRDIISIVGKFDERFFMYAEEDDLCNRMRKANFSVVYTPVPIYHFGEGSIISPQQRHQWHMESVAKFKAKLETGR